ncbi:MAG: DUF2589 domain-containing protein [candidate division Zixibacteria bacterium]|nr:DUF2589 domain-containing protein [candidate division Zixibacteria bacterium]
MAEDVQIHPGAEFQALPLEFIIAAPLLATVKAQMAAAQATLAYIQGLVTDGKPLTTTFKIKVDEGGTVSERTIEAPLLSMVPVPHLRIDSLTTHFKYEITQTVTDRKEMEKGGGADLSPGGFLSKWIGFSVKGSVSSKSSQESSMNRSGVLDITLTASEAPIPEGLSKILGLLANQVQSP